MNFVTYCNIYSKCYINLFNRFGIVADGKRSSNVLANAINHFLLLALGKKEKIYNFNFFIQTLFSSPVIHTILSPFDNPSLSTTSLGIVVRKLFDSVLA